MTTDDHQTIRIRGARVNNLKNIDVDIPKHALTVVTGLSGSGKSSLVFGTLAAESRRLINETYSTFVQSFMPQNARPDVDTLENLSAAIVIDQQAMGANARSTVGTATDAYALLRLLFARTSTPHVGASGYFSFNLPEGMCPTCQGLGSTAAIDESRLVDTTKSLDEGALLAPNFGKGAWYWRYYAESEHLDPTTKLADYTPKQWTYLMHQPATKVTLGGMNSTYEGVVVKVKRVFFKDTEPAQAHIKAFIERVATRAACPECGGTRLAEEARNATVAGASIAQCCSWELSALRTWVSDIEDPRVTPLLTSLNEMLTAMDDIGLGYLSLDREAGTLSGGEAQRVKMVRHLGSALTDVTYVFDEPTVGLHPHDVARMNELLIALREKGNTVVVVEHKPEVIAIADHVIDLGPGAGTAGGEVVYAGPAEGLAASGSITATLLERRPTLRSPIRTPTGKLRVEGVQTNNLKDVTVEIPTGVLVAITGVAGSGKSSLVSGALAGHDDIVIIDQSPIRGSRRSNPATYTGLLDPIRAAFAKANGVKASLFSPNSDGACPGCNGYGVIYTDLAIMAGVATRCEQCEGRRFTPDVLEYSLHGLAIDEVLRLDVAAAAQVFTTAKPAATLDRLTSVGLSYITLGQPLTTLSGGERQRLKVATHMTSSATTYVLDEPSSGLHLADTDTLVMMLDQLVERGRSVIVIEHNLAVVSQADWIIDIGPGAGHDGGTITFTGTPADMVVNSTTVTADHLRNHVTQ